MLCGCVVWVWVCCVGVGVLCGFVGVGGWVVCLYRVQCRDEKSLRYVKVHGHNNSPIAICLYVSLKMLRR